MGHVAGSVSRAYDSKSQGPKFKPHIEHGTYLKKKERQREVRHKWIHWIPCIKGNSNKNQTNNYVFGVAYWGDKRGVFWDAANILFLILDCDYRKCVHFVKNHQTETKICAIFYAYVVSL